MPREPKICDPGRPPASVNDRVVDEKSTVLYVVDVSLGRIGMAYRLRGTEAVRATWDDFRLFFKVLR